MLTNALFDPHPLIPSFALCFTTQAPSLIDHLSSLSTLNHPGGLLYLYDHCFPLCFFFLLLWFFTLLVLFFFFFLGVGGWGLVVKELKKSIFKHINKMRLCSMNAFAILFLIFLNLAQRKIISLQKGGKKKHNPKVKACLLYCPLFL